MLAELQAKKALLTRTETKVTPLIADPSRGFALRCHDGIHRNVLIISRFFIGDIYKWIGPFARSITLFTSVNAEMQLKAGELKSAYTHVVSFPDFDNSSVIELRALQEHRRTPFTHVVSLSEQDLLRAASVRELLGIMGAPSRDVVYRYRDKVAMKSHIARSQLDASKPRIGLPAAFIGATNATDIITFVAKHGYPIVCKPRRGHSSIGASIIRDDTQLEAYLTNQPRHDDNDLAIDVETFVVGTMYHIDGVIINGDIKFVWPSRYVNTCVGFKDNKFLASVSLSPNNPLTRRLQQFAVDVVMCLDNDHTIAATTTSSTSVSRAATNSYPFHCEAWHTPDDKLILCEIGCRAGGADVIDQIRELFDVHMHTIYVEAQLGVVPTKPVWMRSSSSSSSSSDYWMTRRPDPCHSIGWVWMYPHVGTLASIPDDCRHHDVLLYNAIARIGTVMTATDSCVDAAATFLIRGPDETTTTQAATSSSSLLSSGTAIAASSSSSSTVPVVSRVDEVVYESGAHDAVHRVVAWFNEHTKWVA